MELSPVDDPEPAPTPAVEDELGISDGMVGVDGVGTATVDSVDGKPVPMGYPPVGKARVGFLLQGFLVEVALAEMGRDGALMVGVAEADAESDRLEEVVTGAEADEAEMTGTEVEVVALEVEFTGGLPPDEDPPMTTSMHDS